MVCPVPRRTECVSMLPACPLRFPSIPVCLRHGQILSVLEPEELLCLNIKQNAVLQHHMDTLNRGVALNVPPSLYDQ